jgi:hypothetical protein
LTVPLLQAHGDAGQSVELLEHSKQKNNDPIYQVYPLLLLASARSRS